MQPPANPKPDKPAHTAHGEAQQQALIVAAFNLIAEGGFERLRTRDVAQRAGVNIATLHYYFATKEDMIRGVVKHLVAEFAQRSSLYGQVDAAPREELREEFADLREDLHTIPATYIVLFELFLRSFRDPAIRAILREMDEHWQQHIERYLDAGVRQGDFRQDLEPPLVATALIAFIKGCMMQMLIAPDTFPAEHIFTAIENWFVLNIVE